MIQGGLTIKKKFISAILCVAMVASMVVGCGSSGSSESESTSTVESTEESTTDAEETAEVTERTVYVTADWLKSAMDGNEPGYEDVVVAFVGYGEQEVYKQGHIPGAIYVDNQEVEDAVGDVEQPYNLLSAEEVTNNLLSHGITKDTKVVLYGGWYEWMLHDENPVQVGDPASDECEHTTVGELPTDKAAK